MTSRHLCKLLPALCCSLMLSACYEGPTATLHEPGEYEGPTDPLVAKSGNAEHQATLTERFNDVQTDR